MLIETIQKILAGEKEYFSQIVAEFQDMLIAYTAFRIPDRDLVDEVVQKTFIRVYEQLKDYDSSRDFGTWLRTICQYMIRSELKRLTRDSRNRENYREFIQHQLYQDALAESERENSNDMEMALKNCVEKLQDRHKALIGYRYTQNLSMKEISERIGQSINSIVTSLFRIRGLLRTCLHRNLESGER